MNEMKKCIFSMNSTIDDRLRRRLSSGWGSQCSSQRLAGKYHVKPPKPGR